MKTDAEILKRFYKADRILVREGRLLLEGLAEPRRA